ncbi:MAG: hypothetical protein ACI81Q_001886, partial [Paracoccaceae bacterium]
HLEISKPQAQVMQMKLMADHLGSLNLKTTPTVSRASSKTSCCFAEKSK